MPRGLVRGRLVWALVVSLLVGVALVAVVVLMGLYLAARTSRGLVTRPRNVTFDVISLFLLYTAAQGAATALLLWSFLADALWLARR